MSLKRFYADPIYQFKAFLRTTAFIGVACALLFYIHDASFYALSWTPWYLALVPLGIYAGGISAVFIHNATHKSFPNRWLNEFCGELAGVHQLWGFLGWRLIHLVHHQYSDNVEQDPHPPKGKQFGEFLRTMFVRSSLTLSKRYRNHWGVTPRTRALQGLTIGALALMAATCLTFWYLLLGPMGFLFFYVPSYITNHILFAHINYFCHPENPETGETEATNMNHNLGYKLANFFWCGIYFHGNHHRKPMLFNPRYMPEAAMREPEPEQRAA